MTQLELTYPHRAGSKDDGTSYLAARQIDSKASTIRSQVLDLFHRHDELTPEAVCALLDEDILTVRPRFSELKKLGRIRKTKKTRLNHNQKRVRVWELVT
jgi:hypothetical protein